MDRCALVLLALTKSQNYSLAVAARRTAVLALAISRYRESAANSPSLTVTGLNRVCGGHGAALRP